MFGSRVSRFVLAAATVGATAAWSSSPVLADASNWKVGYYNPSGQALSLASTGPGDGIAAFNFTSQPNTALLVTTHGSSPLLGDRRGQTLTATFTISDAAGDFTYSGEGTPSNPCGTPASVRFFFQTDNGGGFAYTHYWWSNPEAQLLANGTWTITATVEPLEWSDWNGQPGGTQTAAFNDAAANVTLIGLSFGGGCFFENGVGTTDGSGTFTLSDFSAK